MASLSKSQLSEIRTAAEPLKGTPYELLYVSAPTPNDNRITFQHTVALTAREAMDVIGEAKQKLEAGQAEWSNGEKYQP